MLRANIYVHIFLQLTANKAKDGHVRLKLSRK